MLGWSWWFLEYTYLSRHWDEDKPKLTRSIQRLRDYPFPYWVREEWGEEGRQEAVVPQADQCGVLLPTHSWSSMPRAPA